MPKVLLVVLKVVGIIVAFFSLLWGSLIMIMYHTNASGLSSLVIIYSFIAILAFGISIKLKRIASTITFLIGIFTTLFIYIFLIVPIYVQNNAH